MRHAGIGVVIVCAAVALAGCASGASAVGDSQAPEAKGAALERAWAELKVQPSAARTGKTPLFLVHYMPWFQAPPVSDNYGWHWHMGSTDPFQKDAYGQARIASHYSPLTGPYDSTDPLLLEYQTSLMKAAGVSGVIVDWYGTSSSFDYPQLQKATLALFDAVKKAGLKFAICYEDQSLSRRVEAKEITADGAVTAAAADMRWAAARWLSDDAYLKINGRPVVLCFGPQYLTKPAQWTTVFSGVTPAPLFVTLDGAGGTASDGGYPWPPMWASSGGTLLPHQLVRYLGEFYTKNAQAPFLVSGAFPGFHDYYAQAGAGKSYGYLDDYLGETFRLTLETAVKAGSDVVQIATWNDYGEGTMIEPTVQNGYRDLETLQEVRRAADPSFPFTAEDLRAPLETWTFKAGARAKQAEQAAADKAARDAAAAKTGPDPFAGAKNLALGRPAGESGHIYAFSADKAFDGDVRTYWEGAAKSWPNEITVDLGTAYRIAAVRVKLNPQRIWGARTQTFSVLVSADGASFTEAAASTPYRFDPVTGENAVTVPLSASGRWVKLSFTANDGATGGQAAEIEVYSR